MPVSDGQAALLLIETVTKKANRASSKLPWGSWIWHVDPKDAASVAFSVITHPDLIPFFAGGGVVLQVGHRVVSDWEEWDKIRDDVYAIWATLGTAPAAAGKIRSKKTFEAATRTIQLPHARGDVGYKLREFKWKRPGASDRSIAAVLQSAVDVATSVDLGERSLNYICHSPRAGR